MGGYFWGNIQQGSSIRLHDVWHLGTSAARSFEGIEGAFEGIEGAFEGIEGAFEGIEGAFEGIEGAYSNIEVISGR